MPTITTERQRLEAVRISKSTGVSYILSPGTFYRLEQTSINKPTPASRTKPKDLFANATARIMSSVQESGTMGVIDNNPTTPGSGSLTVAPYSYWGSGPHNGFPAPDFAGIDGRLRGKIKDSNLNLAQALGEYRQTANLFASTVKDVAGILRKARSGRLGAELVRHLKYPRHPLSKQAANRWLQYQYGIRPLMSDVKNSAEALAKTLTEGKVMIVGTKKSTPYRVYSKTAIARELVEGTLTMRAKARYVITGPAIKQLSEVGITNPLLLAWELMPYSFVIDWFFNVGTVLSSLDSLNGTSKLVVNRSYMLEAVGSKSWFGKDFLTAPEAHVILKKTERFSSDSGLALPKFKYQPSLSLTKITSAMALIRQLRK